MWNFSRRLKEFDDYEYSINGKVVAKLEVLRSKESYDLSSVSSFVETTRSPLNRSKVYSLKTFDFEKRIWRFQRMFKDYELAKLGTLVLLKELGYNVTFK